MRSPRKAHFRGELPQDGVTLTWPMLSGQRFDSRRLYFRVYVGQSLRIEPTEIGHREPLYRHLQFLPAGGSRRGLLCFEFPELVDGFVESALDAGSVSPNLVEVIEAAVVEALGFEAVGPAEAPRSG